MGSIWRVDKDGRNLQIWADTNPSREKERNRNWLMEYGVYASLSPDGSRLVYTSCQYEARELSIQSTEAGKRGRLGYEISIIHIGGTELRRVSYDNTVDHYPEWSPNGDSIAYFAESTRGPYFYKLAISGGKHPPSTPMSPYPPVWSPDSQRLAFLSPVEDVPAEFGHAIYILGPDRTKLNKVGDYTTFTSTLPTWSPNGERLAFAHSLAATSVIYTVKPDGTDLREIWSSNPNESVHPIMGVDWAPDGSELLVVSHGLWTINLDGSEIRILEPSDSPHPFLDATWSPDGSRIAAVISKTRYAYDRGNSYDLDGVIRIVTMARNGTDLKVVVAGHPPTDKDDHSSLEIYAVNPSRPREPADPAACSGDLVIPEPHDNPGLVHDCEVLLEIRDKLAGRASLNWGPDLSILQWEGVVVNGTPARVKELGLGNRGLTGTIPPELGQLTELTSISLSNWSEQPYNFLSGPITPELANLNKLEVLSLHGNFLSGSIPEELAQLEHLQALALSYNFLSGCIPESLRKLEYLRLEGTDLGFCSAAEADGQ